MINKSLAITLGCLGIAGLSVGIPAARYVPTLSPGTLVGSVDVSGLTREDVDAKLDAWWKGQQDQEISLSLNKGKEFKNTVAELGLGFDKASTLELLKFRDFWTAAKDVFSKSAPPVPVEPIFTFDDKKSEGLMKFVASHAAKRTPARVEFSGGTIRRIPEVSGDVLDEKGLPQTILAALQTGTTEEIPTKEAPKKVPDDELAKIVGTVSSYTTSFSEGNAPRASNIRTAARKIDGVVLAPGETFSFNGTVGRRTPQSGFRMAGVYKDGRHDFDFGGGICQVSTTLYNACLLGDLKIASRRNHSMPVPYVPLGRDATVDYFTTDYRFTNSYDFPIAVHAEVNSGRITFTILGQPQPDLQVEILRDGERSWGAGSQTVRDPSLPVGYQRVLERGSSGRAISTWRVVKRGGKVVRRDAFGESYYAGSRQVIAIGTRPVAPKPVTPPTTPAATTPGETNPVNDGAF